MNDFSLQGKVWLGTRLITGRAGAMQWLGDNSELSLKLTTDKSERTESYSGQRLTSAVLQKAKKAEISIKPNQLNPRVLALALYANIVETIAGTVTAEPLPDGLVVGDTVVLDHPYSSAHVITDSTGTPVTLVPGTDYKVESAEASLITLLSLGSPAFTPPLKVAYSYAKSADTAMFTAPIPEKYLVFDGINTLTGEHLLLRLYRCQFDPVSQMDFISADLGELSLSGSVLFDTINAADATLGGFGKLQIPGS
ncbi:hypothetical protein ACFPPA_05600 [Rhodanobacter ginsengisoli]|uniref:Virion structural protein n=1 Tax=Rhodanobacter ginsengisoli TaxID=418646 RepID=A0ABW0QKG5_9GAMM